MDYRYKLRENDEEGKSSRLTVDHDVTVVTPDSKAAIAALKNIDNYGIYISNMRNKSNVEKAIQVHFGNMDEKGNKISPAKKASVEKQRGEKFPVKTKDAIDAFVKSLTSKPTLLTYDIKGDKIVFPKDKNPSIETTKKIIKTVMDTAKVDFKFESDKPSKKSTKESKEKELRLLIREEIKKTLNEGALLSAINPDLQGEVKTPVMKLESYLETLGAKLDYKNLGYIIQDIIDAAQHDYQMMRNKD